jgi:Uma2 family endonuclease
MPVSIPSPPASTIEPLRSRRKFTWQQVDRLVAVGELPESGYELIDGELLDKMTMNPPHVLAVQNVTFALSDAFGRDRVLAQAPLMLNPVSQPEPDIIVLAQSARTVLATRRPAAADALVVCEVSDTTLAYDLTEKARLYARAEIADYWVIDILARRVVVHREPADGTYASVIAYLDGEAVAPLSAPNALIAVADLLP